MIDWEFVQELRNHLTELGYSQGEIDHELTIWQEAVQAEPAWLELFEDITCRFDKDLDK